MNKRDEFDALVKAAHDAIDDYAEARLADKGRDWFAEGLDGKIQKAVHRLLAFGIGGKFPDPLIVREIRESLP